MADPHDIRNPENKSGARLALKILLGVAAFFFVLCVGFVFFIAVVCGRK